MIATPNTTVSILRGTTTDEWGDEKDASTVVLSSIPAAIVEKARQTFTSDDPTVRSVVFYTGRIPAGTDVREGDRLRDETTLEVYIIDDHTRTESAFLKFDLRLDLRRVS